MSDIRSLLNAEHGRPQNVPPPLPVTRKRPNAHPESGDVARKRVCISPTEYAPCPVSPGPPAQHSAQFASPVTPAYHEPNPTIPAAPLPRTVEKAKPAIVPVASQAVSAAPPSSPVPVREDTVDRFARSRTVGQTHRDKERNQSVHMDVEVHQLGQDHDLLCSILRPEEVEGGDDEMPTVQAAQNVQATLNREVRSRNPRVHPITSRTAAVVGMNCLSGSLASLLLEFIAARRNLIAVYGDERRRRPSFLVPPTPSIFTRALSEGRANLVAEADAFGVDKKDWLQWCLSYFSDLHVNWAEYEIMNDHADVEGHLEKPGEPEGEGAVEKTGRGKGPKRCSRCNKFKYAGSGHGRSKCDDHQLISSSIPYPAKPQ